MSEVQHRRPRILVADTISADGLALLEEHFDVDVRTGMSEDELVAVIPDYEGVVVRSATKITARVLDRAERLKVIARAGAGLDTIDVAAAVDRGIEVVNSPDANTLAVAELAVGLLVALARNISRGDAALKEGRWIKGELMGSGLAGKTLGIVGFGRIGQAVAARARAFGMRIVTNQHRPTPELYLEAGVEPLDLYDLLAESDFVSLHVPARSDTEGLIGAEELAAMKPTAYLINTSRGSVVDEAALLAALDENRIAGAALDVFQEEPAGENPLARHPNVIATPHIGASTADAQATAAVEVVQQIVARLGAAGSRSILPVRFVPLDRVVPHEATDPRRAEKLAGRLTDEAVIRNPTIVASIGDRFVVLDGATRTEALRRLNSAHAIVQDVSVEDGLGLETWHHVVRRMEMDDLAELLGRLDGIRIEEVTEGSAHYRMIEYGGLCAITARDGRAFVVYAAEGRNRFAAVAEVADAYIQATLVSRTLERDVRRLEVWYPDMTALVEYPEFTVEQVLLAARSDTLLPAGVTRFIVPGRVLHLDVPLEVVTSDRTLEEKNRWLHDHLTAKEREGKIRYYTEPVYILDE
ncbi:MAG TPA: NAD(P)-dependent oxidoreductase [Acidimicrobiia bacterium]|nr:NAD(P)-dependent oxidoreductase [Acidimicrobiia bacterium]